MGVQRWLLDTTRWHTLRRRVDTVRQQTSDRRTSDPPSLGDSLMS